MAVNVKGVWNCARAVAPLMRAQGGGRIVNVASAIVAKGTALLMHYVTSKGAVVAMTRALARELGPDGHHRERGRAGAHPERYRAGQPGHHGLPGGRDHAGALAQARRLPRRRRRDRGLPRLRRQRLHDAVRRSSSTAARCSRRSVESHELSPRDRPDAGARRRPGRRAWRWPRAIDAACREIGFFAISGHGVPDSLVDEPRACAHEFFALPLAEKLAARHPVAGTNRGYHPVGGEALAKANDAAAPPDLKEFFHVGPVDVRAIAYYTSAQGRQHFSRTSGRPRPPASVGGDRLLPRDGAAQIVLPDAAGRARAATWTRRFFDDKVDRSIGTMRLNYYPAQAVPPARGSSAPAPTRTTAGSRS